LSAIETEIHSWKRFKEVGKELAEINIAKILWRKKDDGKEGLQSRIF